MKKILLTAILMSGVGAASADVLAEWSFNDRSSLAAALTPSGVPAEVSVSGLTFNDSFDFAGLNNSVPASVHDGFGFGGNLSQGVLFLNRATYDDASAVPSPRPTVDDFTSFGPGAEQGTTAGPGNGNAPLSFTVTADSGERVHVTGLLVEWLSGSSLTVGFQQAGAVTGSTVNLDSGNQAATALPDSPVAIEAGETKIFTVSLDSSALDSFHNINRFTLLGSVGGEVAGPVQKTAGVFYSTLYAYDPAYRITRITNFGVGGDLAQKLFGNVDGDAGGRDDAIAVYTAALNASQQVWRVEAALSDGSDFVSPSTWLSWTNSTGSEKAMLGDVDGDGDEDLVFFRNAGATWNVALSTGTSFAPPVLWDTGNGAGSDYQFLEDIDGDGKDDAVISWETWNGGDWRSGLSSGSGFGSFGILEQGFGDGMTHFVGELNNDGKADLIAFEPAGGNWDISINADPAFVRTLDFETGFETGAEFATVYDVDENGSGDLVVVGGDGDAWVRYLRSDLSKIQPRHRWIAGGLCGFRTLYADEQLSIASMDGSRKGQLFTSYNGTWQALPPNTIKSQTLIGFEKNTWELWPNHYLPWYPTNDAPNAYGYYDSGDPDVNDAQIRRMHDLGFSYIMFDITNGHHAWVDDRAKAFIERIRHWNKNLQPGQHKMYFCIALGRTRGITDYTAFFTKLEAECQRAWDEFYSANLDIVYYLHGEPLLIHMLDGSAEPFWPDLEVWAGPREYIDRMTNRTFRNWDRHGGNAPYGWVIEDHTPNHDPTLMTIQPGFGNGGTYYSHDDGNRYKGHWLQVLENDPDSVFVVSWNEWWENNAIEPAWMFRNETEAFWMGGKGYPPRNGEPGLEAYTDELGAQMDDYYYVMTRQYLRLFLDGVMETGAYFKEESQSTVYQVTDFGFVQQTAIPPQAPVLWLPDGYLASNAGYLAFSNRYELVNGPYGHDDADGLDNLTEYGLGGDPTNALDTGYPIQFAVDGGSAAFLHPQLSDPFSGIRYRLELTDNLVSNVWTTNGYIVTGTLTDGFTNGLDIVTNEISTVGKDQQFIRLKIEQE